MNESVTPQEHSVTALLVKWGSGDKAALDELIPLVYDELRKLAASYVRRRFGSNTLQPTALVHEAYSPSDGLVARHDSALLEFSRAWPRRELAAWRR